nr:putative beta-1,4-mannan synthase [Oryza sativa Japonica Group]BAD54677.1 putative beta-1,4-mannan synthase [Oryza sativa Japonica Group]
MSGGLAWAWRAVRCGVVLPTLQLAVYVCVAMSIMLFLERLYMALVVAALWLIRRRRRRSNRREQDDDGAENDQLLQDPEAANSPMVLVQIPMFNEKQVYRLSIGAACGMTWPSDKLVIQVLDDSTDPAIREMVEGECGRWAGKGVSIRYENRRNRSGYKAGAMREGLRKAYARECELVAIFDADFQPDADFLLRTVPVLVADPGVALVQARWRFVNADECLLTRIQEMSLDYHFRVEQEVGSACHGFFGFNGTAGVWRVRALEEAGGWKERTTVEDMDLAVRASLRGWRFVYVGHVGVRNELPSTLRAYRYQQHRWSCGPANLFRKIFLEAPPPACPPGRSSTSSTISSSSASSSPTSSPSPSTASSSPPASSPAPTTSASPSTSPSTSPPPSPSSTPPAPRAPAISSSSGSSSRTSCPCTGPRPRSSACSRPPAPTSGSSPTSEATPTPSTSSQLIPPPGLGGRPPPAPAAQASSIMTSMSPRSSWGPACSTAPSTTSPTAATASTSTCSSSRPPPSSSASATSGPSSYYYSYSTCIHV